MSRKVKESEKKKKEYKCMIMEKSNGSESEMW